MGSFEFHWRMYSQSVSQLYQTCLGRPAGSTEITALATALMNGTPLEVIEQAVLGSQEYYNRAARNA